MGRPPDAEDDRTEAPGATDPRPPSALAPEAIRAALAPLAMGDSIDRYLIVVRVGAGGMGEVYRAHDPQLDRDVALKVLHPGGPGGDAEERLTREAQALARLAHPNVVAVHEVGAAGGRRFVAMEYVAGASLRGWLAAARRPWREVIAVCLDAGAGLAAAHAAGLVHRDVKPENILVGDDGRARIGDFGLARSPGDGAGGDLLDVRFDAGIATTVAAGSGAIPPSTPLARVTVTGAIVGTPAYMAPEQVRGETVDARADQFAFALLMWEALAGARPFAGADHRARLAAIAAGPTTPTAARAVRPAVWRALRRGLASDPADRWPDVAALRAALVAAIAPRRRWIGLVVAAAALAAAGALGFVLWPRVRAEPCTLAGITDEAALAAALADALAAVPGAERHPALVERVRARVAARSRDFGAAAKTVCTAATTRAMAPELIARSRVCLTTRREVARIVLADAALAAADLPTYALKAAAIPTPAGCLDPVGLSANPSIGAGGERSIRAHVLLDAARADLELHRLPSAEATLAEATVATRPGEDPALDAALLLMRGRIAADRDRVGEALTLLADASYAARAAGDATTTLRALTSLIELTAIKGLDFEAAAPWIRAGLAEAEAQRGRAPAGAAQVLMVASAAAAEAGDGAVAVARARAAQALLGAADGLLASVSASTLASALARLGQHPEAIERYLRAIELAEGELGPDHPRVATLRIDLALTYHEAGRLDDANALLARTRDALLAWEATPSLQLAAALMSYAAVESGSEDPVDAERFYLRARQIYVDVYGPEHPDVALIDTDLALFHVARGDFDRAIALNLRALAIQERAFGPDHVLVGGTLFNLAAAHRKRGDLAAAVPLITRAAAIEARAAAGSPEHAIVLNLQATLLLEAGRPAESLAVAERVLAIAERGTDPQTVAHAASAVGAALVALGREPARARKALQQARAIYATWAPESEVFQGYVDEVDGLLARLR